MKFCLIIVVCLFYIFSSISAATFISDGIFGTQVSSERRLLQAKKPCPVNFEFQNYTIITSKCKGPKYPVEPCCSCFKEFACPFTDDLNDLSNDCASTMFSYINLYGKYPPGLFASQCREGKLGLECPAVPPSSALSEKNNSNGGQGKFKILQVMMIIGASLMLLLQFV